MARGAFVVAAENGAAVMITTGGRDVLLAIVAMDFGC